MADKDLRDWTDPDTARQAIEALDRQMIADSNDPDSGVRMCHAQGKTAIYVSDDGTCMVWHALDGTIRRELRRPSAGPQ